MIFDTLLKEKVSETLVAPKKMCNFAPKFTTITQLLLPNN
jgi:hypothetical protein